MGWLRDWIIWILCKKELSDTLREFAQAESSRLARGASANEKQWSLRVKLVDKAIGL